MAANIAFNIKDNSQAAEISEQLAQDGIYFTFDPQNNQITVNFERSAAGLFTKYANEYLGGMPTEGVKYF